MIESYLKNSPLIEKTIYISGLYSYSLSTFYYEFFLKNFKLQIQSTYLNT